MAALSKTFFLIDANSLVHRAYHALPEMTNSAGEPTNALYGLSSILLRLLREEKPDYAAACFDRPEPTYREKEFKDYKAQRPPTAPDLLPQIIQARDLFSKFGIATFEMAGCEADDLIGTLASRFAEEPGLKIIILTGDRDTLQLVRDDKILVRIPVKGISETVTYNEKMVKEKFGLAPEQMIDYKALVGDPSDNIKGVSGIGPKTALHILQKYGSLENALIYEEDDLAVEKLWGQEGVALQAKRLVTLQCDAPLETSLDDLTLKTKESDLREYFEEMGFESLIKRLASEKPPERQRSIF